jgi:site-specific DNA recombinase
MKCTIYARCSSNLQRPTSIEDQVRRCRKFAEDQGWTVVESDRLVASLDRTEGS